MPPVPASPKQVVLRARLVPVGPPQARVALPAQSLALHQEKSTATSSRLAPLAAPAIRQHSPAR
jgi:hypothetical protein